MWQLFHLQIREAKSAAVFSPTSTAASELCKSGRKVEACRCNSPAHWLGEVAEGHENTFFRKPGLAAPTPPPRPVSCQVRLVSVLLSDSRNSPAWKIITIIWIKRREDETSSSFLFSNKLELYSSKWFSIRFGCPSGWSWQWSCVGTAARRQPGPRLGWGHVSANAVIHKEALLSGS